MPKIWVRYREISKNGSFVLEWEAYGNRSWLCLQYANDLNISRTANSYYTMAEAWACKQETIVHVLGSSKRTIEKRFKKSPKSLVYHMTHAMLFCMTTLMWIACMHSFMCVCVYRHLVQWNPTQDEHEEKIHRWQSEQLSRNSEHFQGQ